MTVRRARGRERNAHAHRIRHTMRINRHEFWEGCNFVLNRIRTGFAHPLRLPSTSPPFPSPVPSYSNRPREGTVFPLIAGYSDLTLGRFAIHTCAISTGRETDLRLLPTMFASSMNAFFGWFRGNHNDRLNCDVYSPTAKIDARLPLQASGDFKLDRNARVKFRISQRKSYILKICGSKI